MARAKHKYGAIPTRHAGVVMRSRLEARWAHIFDACRIPWEYEPLDLKGYIPDFIILLHEPVLLECKPAVTHAEFRQPMRKIAKSGWAGPAIIVGSGMYLADDGRPEITARGCATVGTSGWFRVGRTAWPAAWGPNPFVDIGAHWIAAGNATQWNPPKAP